MGFPKHQNFLLLTNTSQITNIPGLGAKNLPKINDTPRAAADARATLLLLLLVLLLFFFLNLVVVVGGAGAGAGAGGGGGGLCCRC